MSSLEDPNEVSNALARSEIDHHHTCDKLVFVYRILRFVPQKTETIQTVRFLASVATVNRTFQEAIYDNGVIAQSLQNAPPDALSKIPFCLRGLVNNGKLDLESFRGSSGSMALTSIDSRS